jgi:hypothetical protein
MRRYNPFFDDSIVVSAVLVSLFFTVFDLSVSPADVIDQRWERPQSSYDWFSASIRNNYPIGQEFTAGMNNITGVELSLRDCNFPSGTATVDVFVREDSIQGSILASESRTFDILEDEWVYFGFGGVIPLTIGSRYVIEATIPSGSDYWCWNAWEDADGIGLPGRLICSGQFLEPGYAFGFRTYAVPEPWTILLLGLGTILLRKRKHQSF